MDETEQLIQGMAGPLLVLDPGEVFDPVTDRVYLIGGQEEGDYPLTVNGSREAPPEESRVRPPRKLRDPPRVSALQVTVLRDRPALHPRATAASGCPIRPRPLGSDSTMSIVPLGCAANCRARS
jgi:hypothetical protein